MATTIEVERLETIDIRRGDLLVLTLGAEPTPESLQKLTAMFVQSFPNNRAIVITPGDEFKVVRPEDGM